jgi:biopolymer transport protein TolR
MASVDTGGDGPNVEVNIVPFIDLMSVLITFLLLTAVWTQVSMIQIGSSIYGKQQEGNAPKMEEDKVLRLDVLKDGYKLRFGPKEFKFPKVKGLYDKKALKASLKTIKEENPEKKDAMISVAENLSFEVFIGGMDILLDSKFPNIGVVTGDIK